MKRGYSLVGGALLAVAVLIGSGGTALAADNQNQLGGTSWWKFVCENGGGTFVNLGKDGWICDYPDGTTVTGDASGPDDKAHSSPAVSPQSPTVFQPIAPSNQRVTLP